MPVDMTGAEVVIERPAVAIDRHVAILASLEAAGSRRSTPAPAAASAASVNHDKAQASHHRREAAKAATHAGQA